MNFGMLRDCRCGKMIVFQPDERKKRKTDHRDAVEPPSGHTFQSAWGQPKRANASRYGAAVDFPDASKAAGQLTQDTPTSALRLDAVSHVRRDHLRSFAR